MYLTECLRWWTSHKHTYTATSYIRVHVQYTFGTRYSPGISTSAVASEKLLKKRQRSSRRKDLHKQTNNKTQTNKQNVYIEQWFDQVHVRTLQG